jgi:DNA-binding transcriptional MocR family regulator
MQHSYLALADRLVADIRAQRYAPGERLPSVRQYAAAQGVSVSTTSRCYRHLEALGYVQARPKSGMYVADWKALHAGRQAVASDAGTASVGDPAPPVAYDQLVSLQHRMTQLYALTQQPLRMGLHLAVAAPAWYPHEALARAGQRVLRRDAERLSIYPTGTGWPPFKAELVRHLATHGVDLNPADLLVTHGGTEALNLALRAVAQPGDAIAVESPAYFGLLQILDNLGLKAVEVPCVPDTGLSLEALDYALTHHGSVRAVVASPSFHNPLGCAMPEARKRELLRLVQRHGVVLIEDDVFGDLAPDVTLDPAVGPQRPQPVKAWDRDGQVIYCGSCSKSISPGLRVGWISAGKFQDRVASLKVSHSLVTPVFDQAVLAEYLASGALPAHLRKLRERLAANVPKALEAVQRHFPVGTQVVSPAGGWWLWLALPEPADTLALLREAVGQGVAFTPGSLFSGMGRFGNHLRLNIGRPWGREMEQAFQCLGALALSGGERCRKSGSTRPGAWP